MPGIKLYERYWVQAGETDTIFSGCLEYAEWHDKGGIQYAGSRDYNTHKAQGFVRIIEPDGAIVEQTFK